MPKKKRCQTKSTSRTIRINFHVYFIQWLPQLPVPLFFLSVFSLLLIYKFHIAPCACTKANRSSNFIIFIEFVLLLLPRHIRQLFVVCVTSAGHRVNSTFRWPSETSGARIHSIFNKRIEYYRKLTHFNKSRVLSLFPTRFGMSLLSFRIQVNRLATCKHRKCSLLTFVVFQQNLWGGHSMVRMHSFAICFRKKYRHDYSVPVPLSYVRVDWRVRGAICVFTYNEPSRSPSCNNNSKNNNQFFATHICLNGFDVGGP